MLMSRTMAIMITATTYGTWLRGDERGWVDDGRTLPPDPELESRDRNRAKLDAYYFPDHRLLEIGTMIGASLISRKQSKILALHVGRWHVHFLVAASRHPVADIVKCAKDAVRYGLRLDRAIWTKGYDKRFCFDDESVAVRARYIERHNEQHGWPAKPWDFITPLDRFLTRNPNI
jgi:hypothetical protein